MVIPGDCVGSTAHHRAGEHTAVMGTSIVSLVVGTPTTHDDNNTISVVPLNDRSAVPKPNQVVLCRVTKVTPRFAGVDIIGVMDSASPSLVVSNGNHCRRLPYPHKATIRAHDIYSVEERDAPGVYESFRPTDLVVAQVIGQGDTSTGLLLSTGTMVELGVVMARSVSGGRLLPVSWNEMVCEETGSVERRKVAKPRQ